MNDPKLIAGGLVAFLIVAFLLSKGSGPTFASGGGPDAASYKAAGDLNTQALSFASADRTATLASLRDVYGLNTTLKSHTLDLQAQSQSERARLDAALALQQSANSNSQYLANIAAATQRDQTNAQLQVSQAQQQGQNQNGIFDFIGNIAKTLLPFLFG